MTTAAPAAPTTKTNTNPLPLADPFMDAMKDIGDLTPEQVGAKAMDSETIGNPIIQPTSTPTPEPVKTTAPEPVKEPVKETKPDLKNPQVGVLDSTSLFDDVLPATTVTTKIDPTSGQTDPAAVDEIDTKYPDEVKGIARGSDGQATWKNIKTELKAERKARLAAEAQLKAVPKNDTSDVTSALNRELAEVKQKALQFEEIVKQKAIEQHPDFQNTFIAPIKKLTDTVKEIAGSYNTGPGALLDLADEANPIERRKMAKALTSEWDAADQLEVRKAIDDLAEKKAAKELILKDKTSNLEMIEKQTKEQHALERDRYIQDTKKAADEIMESEFPKSFPFLKPIEGNQEWNDRVSKIKDVALQLDGTSLNHKARLSVEIGFAALPLVMDVLHSVRESAKANAATSAARIAELEARLEDYVKGTPGAAAGTTTQRETKSPVPVDKIDFLSGVEDDLASISR